MYVATAFLNRYLDENTPMQVSCGLKYFNGPDIVYKLQKELYGQNQAPRQLY